jgi:unsaturated chondroitin disaccharide hydrolase
MDDGGLLNKLIRKFSWESDIIGDTIPYIAVNGVYEDIGKTLPGWRTNGFWPGMLWLLYQYSGDDCLMNLPLLYWAAKETPDSRFFHIALGHLETTLTYLLWSDGSCNHAAVIDPERGIMVENPGGQDYATGSSWSRGQAWAIYGFALSYRYTGKAEVLDAAKRTAHYFIANTLDAALKFSGEDFSIW